MTNASDNSYSPDSDDRLIEAAKRQVLGGDIPERKAVDTESVAQRLHVAATAWNVFAQLGFNPYLQDGTTSSATDADTTDLAR